VAIFKFTNNAEGSLVSRIGAGDSSMTLESGEGAEFPSLSTDEVFPVLVQEGDTYEWMTVTARAGDILSITRGTPAYAFTDAATVKLVLSAGMLNVFFQKGDEREVTEDPDGSLAAAYKGECVYNTTTGVWWKHCTSTVWGELNL